MGNRAVLASFIGVIALITYRDFRHPDSSWPLGPVPPPYRFTYATVVFAIITLVGNIWSEKIATVVASGVLIGVLYTVINGTDASMGLKSQAPENPPASGGATGSTPVSGGSGTIQA
jgi:hypothetical protein